MQPIMVNYEKAKTDIQPSHTDPELICVTNEELLSPKIFEKIIRLIGIQNKFVVKHHPDISTTKAETRELMHSINKVLGNQSLPESVLDSRFQILWTMLEQELFGETKAFRLQSILDEDDPYLARERFDFWNDPILNRPSYFKYYTRDLTVPEAQIRRSPWFYAYAYLKEAFESGKSEAEAIEFLGNALEEEKSEVLEHFKRALASKKAYLKTSSW